uniref:Transcription factor grauzone n=1 Tax=Glossina brevipalpis TaxID=37001 RepID=A0A1A9WJ84_9MUSC
MICRLCLKEVQKFKSAFDMTDCELTMASIIRQHFWFKLQENDQISTVICDDCWLKVYDFHEFYKSIEEAHGRLDEDVVVKIENISKEHSIENVMIQSIPLSSKEEPDDDYDKVNDEVPFDILDENADDSDQDLRTKDSHDILGIQSFGENTLDDVEGIDTSKDEYNDYNDNTCNTEDVMEDRNDHKIVKNKKVIKSVKKIRRTKISLNKSRHKANESVKKSSKSVNCNSKKTKKTPEESKADCGQSLAIDEEIAKFMSLNCDLCKFMVTNFNSLHSHMLAEHKIKGYVRCCNKKFSKRFLLLDHVRQHLNPDCFKCEQCNRVYADRNSMRIHFLSKHKKEEDKMFTCSQCPKKFFRRYSLRQHELVGHSDHKNACLAVDEEIAKFMSLHCELCKEKASNFTAIKGHMRAKHNIKGYVRCCNKKFRERGLLVEHIRAHLNPACYKCEECSLVFPDRQSMRNHFLMKHPKKEDKPFACSQCSNKFVTVYLLQRHKAVAHGDHTRTCSSCCKRFDTAAQLSAHIKEQCLCDTCAEVLCGNVALQRHLLEHNKTKSIETSVMKVTDTCNKTSPIQQDKLIHKSYAHNSLRPSEYNASSLHESFPFQYQCVFQS